MWRRRSHLRTLKTTADVTRTAIRVHVHGHAVLRVKWEKRILDCRTKNKKPREWSRGEGARWERLAEVRGMPAANNGRGRLAKSRKAVKPAAALLHEHPTGIFGPAARRLPIWKALHVHHHQYFLLARAHYAETRMTTDLVHQQLLTTRDQNRSKARDRVENKSSVYRL